MRFFDRVNIMKKKLPQLKDWESTRDALREAIQPLRSAGILGRDSMRNQLEYSTNPTEHGATTGPLNFGGELSLDFIELTIRYVVDGDTVFEVPLEGKSQKSLFESVFKEFDDRNILTDSDSLSILKSHSKKAVSTTPFEINPKHAKDYAGAQWRIYTAMSNFRSQLPDEKTPVVLWPHGFDLSFLWFKGSFDEEKDPHMNFGFSPGFEDARPYLYFYASPVPNGLIGSDLPRNGKWIEQWSTPGGSFDYDEFLSDEDPEKSISKVLFEVFDKASRMMDKS